MAYGSSFGGSLDSPDYEILRSVPLKYNETPFETRSFDAYIVPAIDCPFGTTRSEAPAEEGEDGKTFVLGGIVSGGPDMIEVEDLEINLNNTTNSEKWIFLKVSFTAVVADDILMSGIESVESAVFETLNSLPTNTIPKMASPSGVYYVLIGRYSTGTEPPLSFNAVQCGNITLYHCPGTVTVSRA